MPSRLIQGQPSSCRLTSGVGTWGTWGMNSRPSVAGTTCMCRLHQTLPCSWPTGGAACVCLDCCPSLDCSASFQHEACHAVCVWVPCEAVKSDVLHLLSTAPRHCTALTVQTGKTPRSHCTYPYTATEAYPYTAHPYTCS